MRSFSMVFSFAILFFLLGCGEEQDIHHGEAGFITQFVSENKVLIGDVIYSITSDTEISSSSGESMNKSDLQLGMKIQPYYYGSMDESFPAKAEARLLRVMTDDASRQESVMIINVLQQLKRSENEHFIVTDVERKEDAYILHIMKRSNVDTGSTLTVDAETYEILHMEA